MTTREGVVCPFCGLLCDDLAVDADPADGRLRLVTPPCPIAEREFAAAPAGAPRVAGRDATLDEACARAAEILDASRLPVIAGLATDIAGAKAAMGLAERGGGVVDHAGSESAFRNLLVMLDNGWMTTTLAEVKNRVDLLILAGTDVVGRFPRFFERCVWNAEALFGPKPANREVVYLGDGLDTDAGTAPNGRAPTVIPFDARRLAEVFGAMHALHRGRPVQAASVAGAPIETLQGLVDRMKAARYGVVAWVAADLDEPHGELAVQAICELVMDLNEQGRFSCLPLGGSDNAHGAGQVCTWQAGFPLRTSFAAGHPDFDPHLFSWRRLVDDGEADALVWVSTFHAAEVPVEADVPVIAVVAPGTSFRREPEVYIPVGVPGLDHGGHVVRTDSVTSLPLHRLRGSDLPRAADVLRAIEDRMAGARPEA